MVDLLPVLRAQGGVARRVAVIEAGVSSYAIDQAVAAGDLVRPRRGWVALADADPYLVAAARAGVVLTCITRAKRLGLWVLAEDGPHVGAPPTASRLDLRNHDATVHWARPVQPRPAGVLEDGILNTLLIVATCQPHEAALAVWESAWRNDAALTLRGYHVIRVTYGQVIEGWPDVQEQIMRAVAQGLHRPV